MRYGDAIRLEICDEAAREVFGQLELKHGILRDYSKSDSTQVCAMCNKTKKRQYAAFIEQSFYYGGI